MTPRRLAYLLGLLLGIVFAPLLAQLHAQAQRVEHRSPYAGRVDDPAATYMSDRWLPKMNERAYCVTKWHVEPTAGGEASLVVTEVVDAPSGVATDSSLAWVDCHGLPIIHTHPMRACWLSGLDMASSLLENGDAFIASQCLWQVWKFAILWDRVDQLKWGRR